MSGAGPRERYARDTRIIETREEITLCFGAVGRSTPGDSEPVIDTATHVILTPPAAKRLSQVLMAALAHHESLYGVIDPPVPPRIKEPDATALAGVAGHSPGVDRLLRLVDGLGVYSALERSFKIFPGVILGDRVLVGFNTDALAGDDRAALLLGVCRDLGMPERFENIYRERLPESNVILFGYEGNETGGGTYKAYLEFSGLYITAATKDPDTPPSALLHLGFKWDVTDNRKAALARYTSHVGMSADEMLKRVAQRFYPSEATASYEIVRGIVLHAAGKMAPEDFLYLEVEEEGNPRRSYDINMYRAGFTLKDLYPWLREACRINGIGPQTFHRFYEPMAHRLFGHVSGGQDREGRDFLTFYYGVSGSTEPAEER